MKRLYFLALSLVTILLVSGCGSWRATKKRDVQVPRQVYILAVNDMHAAIENFPRLAYMADSLRAIYPDLLLISAGDNQTGNPVNDQFPDKGMPMVILMNELGFDLSALGNHEFDVSAPQMIRIIEESDFDYICANAVYKDDTHPLLPNKEIVMPNGLRVAFTSVLYINSGGYPDSHPMHTEGFSFPNAIETAKEQLKLRKGNDLLIFVNHFGIDEDVKLANAVPYGAIDLIIGGHSHTRIAEDHIENGILITQAESKLKYATFITLTLHPDGRLERTQSLLTVGRHGNEDAKIKRMVEQLTEESGLDVPIATTEKGMHSKEQLGYMMADAQRIKGEADIAIVNPGGVRISSLSPGDITIKDIYTLDPFGNKIIFYEMTGNELHEMLMKAIEYDGVNPLIPSGVHLKYIMQRTDDENKIKDIELLTTENEPLDMDRTYKVVMNSYVATVYSFPKKETGKSLYIVTADATIDWLRELGQAPDYSAERRIIRVDL